MNTNPLKRRYFAKRKQMFGNILEKVQQAKAKAEAIQADLSNARFEGQDGSGFVSAIVNGNGKLISFSFLTDQPTELGLTQLESMIFEAISTAQINASTASSIAMKEAAKDILPGIPGL